MEIQEITSTQNNFIKFLVKLQNPKTRKEEKLILVDGQKTIGGLINDGFEFEYFICKKNDKFANYKNIKKLILVNDEILKKISTTSSPANCVGIIKELEIKEKEFYNLKKIALIENVKDAGNLGTLIRSAVAFSIDGIILFGSCVDLYNSKTIRATAQNMFKIPIITTKNIEFIKKLKENHKLISTVVNSKKDFMKYDFKEDFILALGSEASGLTDEILNLSDEKLTFFMDKDVESLNLGVCGSICFAIIKTKI